MCEIGLVYTRIRYEKLYRNKVLQAFWSKQIKQISIVQQNNVQHGNEEEGISGKRGIMYIRQYRNNVHHGIQD